MIFILALLVLGDPEPFEPDSINATIFLQNGKKVEVADIRIRDIYPHSFELEANGATTRVDLFRVVQISAISKSREVEILLNDGTKLSGRVPPFDLTGKPVEDPEEVMQYQIRRIERIHFVSGAQLRSCANGHYEKRTPYPFCPVCGNLLNLGPYSEEQVKKETNVLPIHRSGLTGRQ